MRDPRLGNPPSKGTGAAHADWAGLLAATLLAAVAVAAYSRTLSVPLLYDDTPTIAENATIRHWGSVLVPPNNSTASGRPILNLSLAINYALGGTSVGSYHALNLAIHVLAGLALLGIIRRTLAPRLGTEALPLALCASLLWVLHPLQTEAVTYIVQRAESLMGLFYLLTLYCFIRGEKAGGRIRPLWYALCVAACVLGMGTKEVMVSAPLIVLLYDRTFAAGSFREAFRRRWRLYATLASTWLVLAFLVLSTHGRGGTAGSGAGVAWWRYGLTQVPAVVHYLRLCLWPHPLIFDYGTALAAPSVGILAGAVLLVALAAATAWALARKPAIGFLGACFFAILAPSSSVVPVATETMAEHRMYLPLAAVVVLAVLAIHRWLGRATVPFCLALVAALSVATFQRNRDYRSEEAIWSDTAAKCPDNERAHVNLGASWLRIPGHVGDAIAEYQQALRLRPDDAEAHNDMGSVWYRVPGRLNDAVAEYEEAIRLRPDDAELHNNLGSALAKRPGGRDEAIAQYEEALRLRPDYEGAHNNLGNALSGVPGRLDDAIAQYEQALRLDPDDAQVHSNLAHALSGVPGRLNEAIAQYEEAIRLNPGDPGVHFSLGNAWLGAPGHLDDAIAEYRAALRLRPDYSSAHNNLGYALSLAPGGLNEAIAEYEQALRLAPDYAKAHYNLAIALADAPGRLEEAIGQFEEALRLEPDNAKAHFRLAAALLSLPGRRDEARAHLEAGLRLDPGNAVAERMLGELGAGGP